MTFLQGALADRESWSAVGECAIEKTMSVVGTKSAMLIMREAYYGTTRFDDFARRVGITKAAASARLAEFVGGHWMPFGTADFDVRLGAAAQMREALAIAARQVVLPPLEHRPDHRHEIDAGVGQHVFLAATLPGLTVGPARQ